jgi:hypothetical protein
MAVMAFRRTIAELEKLLLTREQITKATKIAELRRRYRCQN